MLYAPVVLSITVIAIIFLKILNLIGLLNYALSFLGMSQINFLGDASLVIPSLALTTIWWNFGFPMLVFLAALYTIPETLYEASKIDGANNFQQFIFITIPLIQPATLFVIVTQFITQMQVFGQPLIMTGGTSGIGGGPGHASYTILLHIYQNAWRYYHVGYAGTMSLALSIFMLIVVAIQFKLFDQKVEY
jgi:multiple sugar transport system permease protein